MSVSISFDMDEEKLSVMCSWGKAGIDRRGDHAHLADRMCVPVYSISIASNVFVLSSSFAMTC